MSSRLSALLSESGVLILDGAQGTELERRGVHLKSSNLWSAQVLIDDPDTVRAVHLDYLRAGADVITTFTYQASIQGFADAGIDAATAATLLNRAVDLAESARTAYLAELQPAPCGHQEDGEDLQAARSLGAQPSTSATVTAHQQQRSSPQPQRMRHETADSEPSQAAQDLEVGIAATEMGIVQLPPSPAACDPHFEKVSTRPPRRCPLIAFSCGSYGAYLADGSEFCGKYAENMSLQQLAEFHRTRLEPVRHRTEIDLLAFETVPCLREAEAIVELLRQERYGKPAWISFSCRDAQHTCHGEHFSEQCIPLLAAAAEEGLLMAAGVNCTAPRHVGALLTAAHEQLVAAVTAPSKVATVSSDVKEQGNLQQHLPGLLLLCYPNSGEEWDGQHRCWRHVADDIAQPGQFALAAEEWVRGPAAVSLVGGCCRTGPEHVRALRHRFFQNSKQP